MNWNEVGELKHRPIATLIVQGEFERAIAQLQEELITDPLDGYLHELLGMTFHHCDRIDEAISAFESASAIIPLEPNAQIALAECYVTQGYPKSASAIYDHLMTLSGQHPDLLPDIVKGYGRLGKVHRALDACRVSVERNPECDKALFGLAFYKVKCGHSIPSVVAVLEKAISLAPGSLEYRVVAAHLCFQDEQFDEARQFLDAVSPTIIKKCKCPKCVQRLCKIASTLELYELAGFCHETLSTKRI